MRKVLKVCAALLALTLIATSFVGCGKRKDEYKGADTLVVGYDYFSAKFSPFFATTAYDQDVVGMTTVGLISTDREGNVVYNGIEGEKRVYNGTEYTYKGITDVKETINSDGTVDYSIKLKEGVKFSDGVELTADDVIFTIYVYCDPTYAGSTTFYALPIEGMADYQKNMKSRMSIILEAGPDGKAEGISDEDTNTFWGAFNKAGVTFAQEIVDYVLENYGNYAEAMLGVTEDEVKASDGLKVAFGMTMWGFGGLEDDGTFSSASGKSYDLKDSFPTIEDYRDEIAMAYGYDLGAMEAESANSSIIDLVSKELGDKADYFSNGVSTGDSAANISGIKKVGKYEISIKMTEFDATAIYNLGIYVAPMHYYGDESKYDYEANKFGFDKGDLSVVKSKTTKPMGAGPYVFQDYSNGVVTFKRNENYFDGCPKITYVKFQETAAADKIPGMTAGTFDITNPSFDSADVASIKKANTNGLLTGNVLTTSATDNLGYGYLGINADTVNVAGNPSSEESKALRKAFATLFAVNREKNILSYYGERATVIHYPISNTSWAAPKPNDEGYALAYSKDADGNSIYTSQMTDEEKKDAALTAAVSFLKKAGFTWDDAAKKFTAAPEGAKMTYEVIIPADGIGDHPSYGILTDTKEQLATIGITLEINDPSDSNVLWDALDAGTQEMWAAAWGATVDPDMYQVYHSSNIVGLPGSSDSNHYHIQDATLDQKIMDARKSADHAYRKGIYKECLEIIMDWGVEIPSYQRQNAYVFSTERINLDTMTPDITTFWSWMNDIQLLEMN